MSIVINNLAIALCSLALSNHPIAEKMWDSRSGRKALPHVVKTAAGVGMDVLARLAAGLVCSTSVAVLDFSAKRRRKLRSKDLAVLENGILVVQVT
jgi:hypothetical protein